MHHAMVRAKIHTDNSGCLAEIPVIITPSGPLNPPVEYLLERCQARSFSWMQKLIQAVGLLLDYMASNHGNFEDPKELFSAFVQRLSRGDLPPSVGPVRF